MRPRHFEFVDDAGGVCSGTVCNWTNGNNLEPGGERTATVSIRVADDAEAGGSIKASLRPRSPTGNTSERFACQNRSDGGAQRRCCESRSIRSLRPLWPTGEEFHAIVEVSNTGAASADRTTVTLNVPEGASFNSAMPEGTESGGVISWSLADLAVGKAANLQAFFDLPAGLNCTPQPAPWRVAKKWVTR